MPNWLNAEIHKDHLIRMQWPLQTFLLSSPDSEGDPCVWALSVLYICGYMLGKYPENIILEIYSNRTFQYLSDGILYVHSSFNLVDVQQLH